MTVKTKALRIGLICVFIWIGVSGLQAASVTWSNGTVNLTFPSDLQFDCGGCALTGAPYTAFDNFSVPAGPQSWQVSSFDFTDWFIHLSNKSDYKDTRWSIWNGDPLTTGKLVASGLTLGTLTDVSGTCGGTSTCLEKVTVSGLNVTLASGNTYYLGVSNVLAAGGESSGRAYASGGNAAGPGTSLAHWEISDGSTTGVVGSAWTAGAFNFNYPAVSGSPQEQFTAFDIIADQVTPEPGTLTLLSVALAGFGYFHRRRRNV